VSKALSLLSLAGGLLAVACSAADTPVYTLDDCLLSGQAHSARLANATRDNAIAAARIRQVRAQILPQLTARGQYTYQEEVPVAVDVNGVSTPLGRTDNFLFAGEISQLLYSGGSVNAGLNAAAAYRDLSLAAEAQARAELDRDIRQGFVNVLLAQAVADVRSQVVTQLESWVTQVDARFRQGTVSEFELNSARVRVANERPPLIRARADVELACTRLRNLARLDRGPFALRGELQFRPVVTNSLAELQREALAQRPELVQARQRVILNRADVRASQGQYAPRIRARAGSTTQNPPAGTALDDFDWGWNAGVVADWTLFDGGLREAEIAQKRLELAKAEEDLGEMRRMIELEIEALHAELLRAAEAVAATAENVALARQNLGIARTRYEAGLVTYLEFTDAELALRTASLGRLEALAAHERSVAALMCAAGRPVADAGKAGVHEQP
jgi:outer membrane protein TolC